LRQKLAGFGSPSLTLRDSVAELQHGITYRSISVHAYPAEISNPPRLRGLRWFPISSLRQAAISQLARKIAQRIPFFGFTASTPSPPDPSPPRESV
jgi:hypothetical protein